MCEGRGNIVPTVYIVHLWLDIEGDMNKYSPSGNIIYFGWIVTTPEKSCNKLFIMPKQSKTTEMYLKLGSAHLSVADLALTEAPRGQRIISRKYTAGTSNDIKWQDNLLSCFLSPKMLILSRLVNSFEMYFRNFFCALSTYEKCLGCIMTLQ